MKSTSKGRKERKQLRAQQSNTEPVDNLVFNTMSSHICILDMTGTILAVNQAWRDFANANQADPDSVFRSEERRVGKECRL